MLQFLLHLNKDRFAWLLGLSDVARIVASEPQSVVEANHLARRHGVSALAGPSASVVAEILQISIPIEPSGTWRDDLWAVLWPDRVFLRGDLGWLLAHRRQLLMPFLMEGGQVEALRYLAHLALPPPELVELWFPEIGGPYPYRLVAGRLSRLWERTRAERLARRLEERPRARQ